MTQCMHSPLTVVDFALPISINEARVSIYPTSTFLSIEAVSFSQIILLINFSIRIIRALNRQVHDSHCIQAPLATIVFCNSRVTWLADDHCDHLLHSNESFVNSINSFYANAFIFTFDANIQDQISNGQKIHPLFRLSYFSIGFEG